MKKGFTLVELSIVLVIIGLLIGGILIAQSMIRAAQINKVLSNLAQVEIAVINFQNNYKQIPGDSNIFQPPGNNNKDTIAGLANCPADHEMSNTFAHLSQAGMIKGNYVTFCSAPATPDYANNRNAGVLYPIISTTKINYNGMFTSDLPYIILAKISGQAAVMLGFTLAAEESVAVEKKMGLKTMNDAASNGGLYNANGADNCTHNVTNLSVNCMANKDSSYGNLNYYATPQ